MKKILIAIFLTIFISSCSENKTTNPKVDCGNPIKIVADTTGISRDIFELEEMKLDNDCLTLLLSYSGGCKSVDFQLYSFGEYELDGIIHKKVFISLKDEDPCDSFISKDYKFDISGLTKILKGKFYLNFVNANDSLLVN